mmetsp:Transcript_36990/g.33251  ORF Transcript_36990/g.33251 Transcript_36990/m.33251 type:complete len:88 (-) Transcript_36990:2684-2947(-)
MEAVSGFFSQNNFGATLNLAKTELKIHFEGQDDPFADEREWIGFTFLDMKIDEFEKAKENMFLTVKQGKTEEVIKIEAKMEEIKDLN